MKRNSERSLVSLILLFACIGTSAFAQFGSSFSGEFPAKVSAVLEKTETENQVQVVVTATVQDGYYTYGMDALVDPDAFGPVSTRVNFSESSYLKPSPESVWTSDPPKTKFDTGFETEVRYHDGIVNFRRTYEVTEKPEDGVEFEGSLFLQICDNEICLPPRKVPFKVSWPPVEAIAAEPTVESTSEPAAESSEEKINSIDSGTDSESGAGVSFNSASDVSTLQNSSIFAVAGIAFLAGILSLLTPCVFPMIPITISFFTKRAGKSTKERLLLVGTYSGSIVIGFSLLGFGLALLLSILGFGSESAGFVNVIAAHPVVNLLLALFFVMFAFSLFGVFEIGLPGSWANKLQQKKGNRSDMLGAMLMAMIFVMISFTCTAPIVGPLIVLTVQGGVMLPAIGLTFYAIGFALPFFLLGLAPGALNALPKSGGWLNAVKVTLGLVELGIALIYFAKADLVLRWGIFTREIILSAWVGLSLVTALYLLGLFRLSHDSETKGIGPTRLGFSVIFASMAMYFAFGLFSGRIHSDLEALLPRSLNGDFSGSVSGSVHEEPEFIMNDLEAAQALSLQTGKPLFIDFTGWTCTNCQRNAVDVFPRPDVRELMEQYVLVALYTDDAETGEKWQKYQNERFGTFSLPFYATLTPNDQVIATYGGLIREGQREEFKEFLRLGIKDRQVALVP